MFKEFKEFAIKGNVVDMAVGVIIGAAFGKIVSSLVENVIMPPLGMALSGVNFSDLGSVIGQGPDGKDVLLKYGAFFQTIFDFVIIAFVANAVIRDDETGFAPILRATRISKFDYLVGRFVGATATYWSRQPAPSGNDELCRPKSPHAA